MYQVTLYVLGICCINSIHSIEQELKALCGIISFKGSMPKGKIVIKYKPSLISSKEIINSIEERGFAIAKKIQHEQNNEIYN
ncbi:hypothetical protein COJ85_03855 [Bacillus sp. AFS076308]|uniref:cation transporter n=1 Tax=unclassified Bacillus (in: firmicutes) TaxID=185979 RepID=UPI000BF28AE6|nr:MULTISPECIES: cation transporter [unclassified Bacillus (in: firmicutes)]PFO08384.1 hypothetical protein COJ85_03855 [Bacillus sp. AFS076308]PGV50607.1 hypothetical protein COD92_16835 [Bacillus sp. AFS037270]